MKNTIYTLLAIIFLPFTMRGQEAPASLPKKSILIMNGTAHLGNGKVIKRSAIALDSGKITMVKDALIMTIDFNQYDTIIDASGKHLYPGFIAPNTSLGLLEVEAVRATADNNETGEFLPHVRSIIAYNTDSEITPTIRTNGVLLGQITPRGGIISGTSSVVHFDAWNWEDAVIKMDDGVHLNWPNVFSKSGWWAEPGDSKKAKNYLEKVKNIQSFFAESKAYCKGDSIEINLIYEAMRGVFNGDKKLYVNASFVKEISDVINLKKEFKIPNVVIVGGYDAWMEAARLKENSISVILQRPHTLPEREDDAVDLTYRLPKLLKEAGVNFCIQYTGDMEQMGTRNLPFVAGTAVAHGLAYEDAVAAISLNTATILGIEKNYGSIEVGKSATLFVSDGDALDMKTNNVVVAFIDGRMISLDNHQKRNYEKYKKKYQLD